jgi:hypothetical protein
MVPVAGPARRAPDLTISRHRVALRLVGCGEPRVAAGELPAGMWASTGAGWLPHVARRSELPELRWTAVVMGRSRCEGEEKGNERKTKTRCAFGENASQKIRSLVGATCCAWTRGGLPTRRTRARDPPGESQRFPYKNDIHERTELWYAQTNTPAKSYCISH